MVPLPSGLAERVDDGEELARFLTSSNHFNSVMVKPAAFLPDPKTDDRSVFRHGAQPRATLWQIAVKHLLGGHTLHGAAIVRAAVVRAAALDVIPKEPPQRHARILGWDTTTDDPELRQARRKEQAIVLASRAELIRREPNLE